MKLSNKNILAIGTVACAGMIFAVAGQASSDKNHAGDEKPAANSMIGMTGSYGATKTKIIGADTPMFSHTVHVVDYGLDCSSCHTDTFQKKHGAADAAGDYTMKSLEEGKYCGLCHDGDTAFGVKEPDTCVSCHGSNMEQPGTIYFEKPVKAVIFDHTMHTEDMGLACTDCHNQIFKMKLGSAEEHPEKFTMEALYAGKFCGVCHDGDSAFASDTKCTSCHIGVKGFDRLFGDKTKGDGHGGH